MSHLPDVACYRVLRTADGGNSREVFIGSRLGDGRPAVLRVYGAGARRRGPEAPRMHAAVLDLARQHVLAPRALEVRETNRDGSPAVLVTSLLPGEVLDSVLLACDDPDLHRRLGTSLGEQLARLGRVAMPGGGSFLDDSLTRIMYEEGCESLLTWLDRFVERPPLAMLPAAELDGLREACREADKLLAVSARAVLTHGDLSARNVLCDPETGTITGLFDWEFAHAGHPMEDAGHLLRERWSGPFADALLTTYGASLPPAEQADLETLRRRARAADLYWIIEIASRLGQGTATLTCHRLVREIGARGSLA